MLWNLHNKTVVQTLLAALVIPGMVMENCPQIFERTKVKINQKVEPLADSNTAVFTGYFSFPSAGLDFDF